MDLSRLVSPQKIISGKKIWRKTQAPYTVVAEHEGWQERDYPQTRWIVFVFTSLRRFDWSRWVSTDYVDIFAHDGDQHREAFEKLFQFISGKNSDSVEIPMTAPVTFRFVQQLSITCSKNSQNNSRRGSKLQQQRHNVFPCSGEPAGSRKHLVRVPNLFFGSIQYSWRTCR